jgi:hypothetical protein
VCDLNGSQVREMSNLRKHLKLLLLDCGQVWLIFISLFTIANILADLEKRFYFHFFSLKAKTPYPVGIRSHESSMAGREDSTRYVDHSVIAVFLFSEKTVSTVQTWQICHENKALMNGSYDHQFF